MKNIKIIILAMIAAITFTACGSDEDEPSNNATANANANTTDNDMPEAVKRLEFPKVKGGNSIILVHEAVLNSKTGERGVNYCVEYDCAKRSQRWSCYQMYASINATNTSRYRSDDNQYPQDPLIPSEYQFPEDPFWYTGYDHGHICPSADRLGSYEANKQTFYLSNMQPQVNGFNAQVWANMEIQLRTWNRNDFRDTLYVCKGGTIDSDDLIITTTKKGLIIPKYFFMAILCKNSLGYKALGFWIEHKVNNDTDLSKYVVSIDDLELKTGIDFFCNLPDEIENRIEALPVENIKRAWGFGN